MKRLHETSPIWHAIVWIAVYVVLAGVGDWLSALAGVPNLVTTLLFVALSVGLFLYVKRNGWTGYYGLRRLRGTGFKGTLLYLPLLIIALMACVSFLEELLFRGFLFRGILKRGTLIRAVLVSGVTFGIGHAVNLARGFTAVEQVIQIGFGIVLGIVLALLFAVTGTIWPLIIFHFLLNISGNLTPTDSGAEAVMLGATTIICIGYGVYLMGALRRQRAGGLDALQQEPAIR